MSDQPNPSDEAHRLFEPEDEPNIISKSTPSLQPKPTTANWEQALREMKYNANSYTVRNHAALALEALSGDFTPAHKPTAESQGGDVFARRLQGADREIEQLRDQLATTRLEAEKFARLCRGFKADIASREQQLATAVEALKQIRDKTDTRASSRAIAHVALAKIGGK